MKRKKSKDYKRIHIIYSGRVQGVGFRYTTEAIAHEAKLKGWVRNLRNGDVEVVAEGDKVMIESFQDNIHNSAVGRFIRKEEISWLPYTNEFSDFRIEFLY